MTEAFIPLEELFARNGNALDAFGGGDRDVARIALVDYLARRLRTLILPRVRGNVAIKVMGIRRNCCCRSGGTGRGGKGNDGGGKSGQRHRLSLRGPAAACHCCCRGLGRTPTLEVILHASSVVTLSSKSAAQVTACVDNGIRSAAASAAGEELARAEQKIWGDNPAPHCPPMRMGIPPILAFSSSQASGAARWRTGLPPMALVPASCRQQTMV